MPVSDATSLQHCLKNKQVQLSGKDPAKGVFIFYKSPSTKLATGLLVSNA